MKLLIFILSAVTFTTIAHARSESSLERTVRCSNNPDSYNCGSRTSSTSSWPSDTPSGGDTDGMNDTERAYCKETGNCGPKGAVAAPAFNPAPQARTTPRGGGQVPAYLLPPKRDDRALHAMHEEISRQILQLESYIQGRQYGASAELAQRLMVYAQEQVGFDSEVQLQEKIQVQGGALAWPNQQRNDAMAIALKQYRGGLYVKLLNMYKRVKLMWTVANYNVLKQRGSIKPGAKETLRNEMLTAYMVPIYFVDQMQPQAYVLTFDFMLVNPIANFHYNAELEIVADSLKELGFTSATFVEQAKSLALSKVVVSAQSAPTQQASGNPNTDIANARSLSDVLIAREDAVQAQIIPRLVQQWALSSSRRTTLKSLNIISQVRDSSSYFNRSKVSAEGVLADGAVCKFEIFIYLSTSGATNRTIYLESPSNDATGHCY